MPLDITAGVCSHPSGEIPCTGTGWTEEDWHMVSIEATVNQLFVLKHKQLGL
jgi:hypothetical protein